MKLSEANIKNIIYRKPFAKRFILMIIGVVIMGICVAFLNLCHFGTDPYSAINYGLARVTGISFGTWELLVNAVLLFAVLFFDVSKLGLGTIGNMVVIGYTADFTTFILDRFFNITELAEISTRIIVMIFAVLIFVVAVALYINAGLGSSPYDALPYVIHEGICKKIGKKIPFKYIRILFDALFTTVAFIIHGEVGIITVLMVLTLGPVIDIVAKITAKIFKINN